MDGPDKSRSRVESLRKKLRFFFCSNLIADDILRCKRSQCLLDRPFLWDLSQHMRCDAKVMTAAEFLTLIHNCNDMAACFLAGAQDAHQIAEHRRLSRSGCACNQKPVQSSSAGKQFLIELLRTAGYAARNTKIDGGNVPQPRLLSLMMDRCSADAGAMPSRKGYKALTQLLLDCMYGIVTNTVKAVHQLLFCEDPLFSCWIICQSAVAAKKAPSPFHPYDGLICP